MNQATLEHSTTAFARPSDLPPPDGHLLQRYVATHDEGAFTSLVERYGGLVWGVCQRVLRHSQDAEDAFQATFLVLARRAASLDDRGPLSNWLYAVAYRTAIKARQVAARRRARELQGLDMSTVFSSAEEEWSELRPLLDEELNQLPNKYRAPLVLCYLEGKTNEEAARALGWPIGSMSRRMNRARDLLHKRLTRRGLALSSGLVFMLIADKAGAAIVSPALVGITSHAALSFATGQAGLGAAVSRDVVSLAEEVLRPATLGIAGKIARLLLILTLLGLIGTLGGSVVRQVRELLQPTNIWGCGNPPKADPQK
jgi:RNA polymerase sigma-70 factor (ECF subfamily)